MKVRTLILLMLITLLSTSVTAQQVGRKMLVNEGGKVVASYILPEKIDSLTFSSVNYYNVTASPNDANMGRVELSSSCVASGETVTITATPRGGYLFSDISKDGEVISADNPCVVTITENSDFIVNFKYDPYNAHEAVDLGLSVKWATCNVGATTPEDYGDYFAWGETSPKATYDWSSYKWCNGSEYSIIKYIIKPSDSNADHINILELCDDAARVNWGGDWRMPTRKEAQELIDNCTFGVTTQNGVGGYKVTSNINGNSIYLPKAGSYNGELDPSYNSDVADYWTSSISVGADSKAYEGFSVDSYDRSVSILTSSRYMGQSIRPVCDTDAPATPQLYNISVKSCDEKMGVAEVSKPEARMGESITLTATPNSGYKFTCWVVGDDTISFKTPYTAKINGETRFTANFKEICYENGIEYIDLELPSGVKWATCNVGTSSPYNQGKCFAWGETEYKTTCNWSTYKHCNGTSTSLTKYCLNPKYGEVDNKVTLDLCDDVANLNYGGTWRMPTKEEFEELRDSNNCIWEYETINEVPGYKVTSRRNGESIFLPHITASYDYWSSSLNNQFSTTAYYINLPTGNSYVTISSSDRISQRLIRPVCNTDTITKTKPIYKVSVSVSNDSLGRAEVSSQDIEEGGYCLISLIPNEGCVFKGWSLNGEIITKNNPYSVCIKANSSFVAILEDKYNGHEYVDLGLPSGIKWATCNVGASSPEEVGTFYSWRETEPYDGVVDGSTPRYLSLAEDAAHVNWGGEWRMPTKDEISELGSNCTWEWTTQNGVSGYKGTSKINNNIIFLPVTGIMQSGELGNTSNGYYWTATSHTNAGNIYYLLISSTSFTTSHFTSLSRGLNIRAVCP